jgi:hypothetical protein
MTEETQPEVFLAEPVGSCAELDPGILREAVLEAVAVCLGTEPAISYEWKHLEAFKPGRPQPTHRITTT